GTAIETFRGHKGPVFAVAFASNGTLVSGAADRSAVVWDLNPGWTLERTLGTGDASSPISDRVNALRFSPDGKRLATGGGEPTRGGEIKIWNVAGNEHAGQPTALVTKTNAQARSRSAELHSAVSPISNLRTRRKKEAAGNVSA